jgi:hypothetical protein
VKSPPPKPSVLIALCALGVALWNFPLMLVWSQGVTVFGIPLLPAVLFASWAGLVAALAWVSEKEE